MTPLRQRMIDDMRLAGFAERTRDVYIQAVRRLAAHYMRSPDVLSEEEVRAYLLHLRRRSQEIMAVEPQFSALSYTVGAQTREVDDEAAERDRGSQRQPRSRGSSRSQ